MVNVQSLGLAEISVFDAEFSASPHSIMNVSTLPQSLQVNGLIPRVPKLKVSELAKFSLKDAVGFLY